MWSNNMNYLSEKEVKDFFNGKQEILEEAAKRRRRNSGQVFNVFDGLVYQKEYEISKKNIYLNKDSVMRNGKFSKTFRAKLEGCKKDYAVEVWSSRSSKKDGFKAMLSEVKMLCYVSDHHNNNIVGLTGCYSHEIREGVLWVVKEYFSRGTLIEYMQKCGEEKEFSVNEMIRFSKEIACGMEYLSDHSVIHGGLRAKHVYLDQNKTCKLGNFGLSKKLVEYQMLMKKRKEELLPWRWMACETLQNLTFSIQSDVWSYGVTIWEVFSLGEVPYGADNTPGYYYFFIIGLENGKKLEAPTHATEEIFDVMERCWALEQQNRPTFEELHKFFLEMTETIIT